MENKDVVAYTRSRKLRKQQMFLEDLNNAVNVYVYNLLEGGNDDKLSGDEFYQYCKYKSNGIVVIPITARVIIQNKLYCVGEMLETFINGRYDSVNKLSDIEQSDINEWLAKKQLQYNFDRKDRHTKELVTAIKEYIDKLILEVENGGGTERQKWEYKKMKLGEPLELVYEAGVEKKSRRNLPRYKLMHRIITSFNDESGYYHKDVMEYLIKKYNIVFRAEDKNTLRQKEVIDAINKYKEYVVDAYNDGSLKKKDLVRYESIIKNEPFTLPYRVIVNLGTEEFPLDFELGRTIELMEERILAGKRNALVTDDMSLVNRVIEMGVKLEDSVLEKVNEINIQNSLIVGNQ